MAKRKTKKRRELKKGERVVVYGVRGKPVKKIVPNRKYLIKILKGKKVVETLNTKYPRGKKKGEYVPREVSKSSVDRLRFVKTSHSKRKPTLGNKYKITKNKPIKEQISKEMLREIRKNKGKAFSILVKIRGSRFATIPRYMTGEMSTHSLENLITSDLIFTINRENYRISPRPTEVHDAPKIKRISEAQLELQFHTVNKARKKKKKPMRKKKNAKTGHSSTNKRSGRGTKK